jgi:hypothetical protein
MRQTQREAWQTEYMGYTIFGVAAGAVIYWIEKDGVYVCRADSEQHARELIDKFWEDNS